MRRAILLVVFAACGRIGFDHGVAIDTDAGDIDAITGLQPLHQYRFLGNFDDDFGGPSLVPNGGTIGADSYTFLANQGLSLDGAMPHSVYTLDIVFAFSALDMWNKIVDFRDLGPDTGIYTYFDGFQIVIVPGSDFLTTESRLGIGTLTRLTLTRDASANVVAYLDGEPAHGVRQGSPPPPSTPPTDPFTFVDSEPLAEVANDRVWFFQDDAATGDEAGPGMVRRIRIYDVPLSAQQVAENP